MKKQEVIDFQGAKVGPNQDLKQELVSNPFNGYRKILANRWLFILVGLVFLFLAYQFSPFSQQLDVGTVGARSFLANFGNPNPDGSRTFPQAPGDSYLNLYRVSSPSRLSFQARLADQNTSPATLLIFADGQELGQVTVKETAQVFTFTLKRLQLEPQDLTLLFRVMPAGSSATQGHLKLELNWVNLQPDPERTGLSYPPFFQLGWWLAIALWPWFMIWLLKIQSPRWCGNLLYFLNLGLICEQLGDPQSSTYLHTNWLVGGLELVVVELAAGITWLIFNQVRTRIAEKGQSREKILHGKRELLPLVFMLLALSCLYLATARGYLLSPDEVIMQGVTAATLKGNPFQPLTPFLPSLASPPLYSKYGIGLSIVGVPFYYLGAWVSTRFPYWYNELNGSFGVVAYFLLFTELFVTVGGVALFYWMLRLVKFTPGVALLCAGLYGTATMAWHYARTFFSEPLVTFSLLFALVAVLKYHNRGGWQWAGVGGFMLGLAVATRLTNITLIPVFGLYMLWLGWHKQVPHPFQVNRQIIKTFYKPLFFQALAWVSGLGLWLLVVAVYNYARFHSLFATGYEEGFTSSLWEGFYGLVFSPGKSVFLYNPILILGLVGFWKALKAEIFFTTLTLLIVAIYLLTYSSWYDWGGGGVWGPRFLLPVIPLLLWPAAFWFAEIARKLNGPHSSIFYLKWLAVALLVLVCGVSLFIQFLSVVVDFHFYLGMVGHDPNTLQAAMYNFSDSPIVGQWNLWSLDTRGDMAPYFYFETSFARFVRLVHDAGFSLFLLFFLLTLCYSGSLVSTIPRKAALHFRQRL